MPDYKELYALLIESCREYSVQFNKSIQDVEKTQAQKLATIIRENAHTEFGQRHNFKSIKSIHDFRTAVPVKAYEDYEDYIAQIADGRQGVLTMDKVLMLEPTSGSTLPSKFIPYTESLKREFQQGIWSWLYDILTNRPKLREGPFYWSITPVAHKKERTRGGIPIGFGDDGIYFTPRQQELIAQLSAVPFDVAGIQDINEFKERTLSHLLSNKDLSFVSVWNPTFLSLLLRNIKDPEKYLPNLSLISCWTDGNAANYIKDIKKLFPQVEIQGKGLISTEGFISFPLVGYEGSALSVNSHFFEFRDTVNLDDIRLAHELEKGKEYETILTTSGGLYRYNLEDIVKVVGFNHHCPLIRFMGRNNRVSDLFGEKLNEYHVSKAVNETFRKHSINPSFFMIAPEKTDESTPAYTLFVESEDKLDGNTIAAELDNKLQGNYHYKHCRRLGQLDGLRIFLIDSANGKHASDVYLEELQARGKKIGNVKPAILSSRIDWSEKFKGRFVT